jgi:ubiquinone/menaquinone biosynthesis C-methylase UbiE
MKSDSILELIKKTKSKLTPEQFQERVNVVFHDHEAIHYDKLHKDMMESLQEQIDLLVYDVFENHKLPNNLKLLDIGCGTGLSTQFLINSRINSYIDDITLLDTSSNMLKQAEIKATNWNKKYRLINGYLSDLSNKFDLIIISSVLHHIPNLELFLNQVSEKLNSNGILIHLQDPNGDYLNDNIYLKRTKQLFEYKKNKKNDRKWLDYLPKKLKQFIKRIIGRKSYIDLVNDVLISEKSIYKPMTANEIWSVTDIHVELSDDKETKGISFNFLKNHLKQFDLIKQRSYGFYGELKSELNPDFKENESKFIQENQLNGRNIACVWIKKN